MKDKQIAPSSAEPRIFLVSAGLHCISLTGLVFLRSSFGFGYLRPKSIFFAFSWALALYSIYAWIDGSAWREHRALIVFGAGAFILYWTHLLVAFIREWKGSGEHEQYSGVPHLVWLMRGSGNAPSANFDAKIRLWGEPATVLIFTAVFRIIFGMGSLSRWLVILAVCLWSKEAFNHWFRIRQRKRQKDIFSDTEDIIEPPTATNSRAEPPSATRTAKVKRTRNAGPTIP